MGLMGMSRQRVKHVLDGKEMVESSDTDEDTGDEVEVEKMKNVSDIEEESPREVGEQSVVSQDPTGATSLKKTNRIKFKEDETIKKVILTSDKRKEKKDEDPKKKSEEEEKDKDKGKTLMELLELEM